MIKYNFVLIFNTNSNYNDSEQMIKISPNALNSISQYSKGCSKNLLEKFFKAGTLNELSTDIFIKNSIITNEKGKDLLKLDLILKGINNKSKKDTIFIEQKNLPNFLQELSDNISLSLHKFMQKHSIFN